MKPQKRSENAKLPSPRKLGLSRDLSRENAKPAVKFTVSRLRGLNRAKVQVSYAFPFPLYLPYFFTLHFFAILYSVFLTIFPLPYLLFSCPSSSILPSPSQGPIRLVQLQSLDVGVL